MRKEIAEKWVAALRSGEYKQTSGILANHNRTEHCCLGVLCELAIKAGVEMQIEREVGTSCMRFDGEGSHLPDCVQDWADTYGEVAVVARQSLTELIHMNDKGCSFEDIADVIEEHWETL